MLRAIGCIFDVSPEMFLIFPPYGFPTWEIHAFFCSWWRTANAGFCARTFHRLPSPYLHLDPLDDTLLPPREVGGITRVFFLKTIL